MNHEHNEFELAARSCASTCASAPARLNNRNSNSNNDNNNDNILIIVIIVIVIIVMLIIVIQVTMTITVRIVMTPGGQRRGRQPPSELRLGHDCYLLYLFTHISVELFMC